MEQVIEFVTNLFLENGIIIAVGAFCIGQVIKMSLFDFIPNKYIPLIGAVFGAICGIPVFGVFGDADIVTSIISGMALGLAATGGFELVKNIKNSESEGA